MRGPYYCQRDNYLGKGAERDLGLWLIVAWSLYTKEPVELLESGRREWRWRNKQKEGGEGGDKGEEGGERGRGEEESKTWTDFSLRIPRRYTLIFTADSSQFSPWSAAGFVDCVTIGCNLPFFGENCYAMETATNHHFSERQTNLSLFSKSAESRERPLQYAVVSCNSTILGRYPHLSPISHEKRLKDAEMSTVLV